MGAVVNEEAFCLKWNDFHTSLTSTFTELRAESDLLDATIFCEGQLVRAHKLVLSASSTIFRQLFRNNDQSLLHHSQTVEPVLMMWDVKSEDLKLLLDFMYQGQVNVAHENLNSFLALAERLQVRGLTSNIASNNSHRTTTNSLHNSNSKRPISNSESHRNDDASPSPPMMVKRARPSEEDLVNESLSVPETEITSAINIKQEELKVDPNSEQQQSSAIYNNATCSQFTTQFNQFYENNGVHHGGAGGASNQIDHVTSGLRQTGNVNNNADDGSALIPVTSSTNNQGSFVQTSPGITTCAGIISATGEEFPINHQNLVDHKGVVVINTGGHLSTASTASSVAAAAAAAAGTPTGLIIPHSALVGNSLASLQQHQQQPQGTASGGSGSPSPTSGGPRANSTGNQIASSSNSNSLGNNSNSNSSQNNGGTCVHCHKTFRQLRSHIQDVHCPTPTPCPLCGKMFSSKHKMFGHKYRSCPNRTRNLVRHLQDLDHTGQPIAGGSNALGGGQQPQTVASEANNASSQQQQTHPPHF